MVAVVPGTALGFESIDSVWLTGMPSSAGCAQPSPLCFDCDTFSVTLKFTYHTSNAPVTYKTHLWIYEDDWPSNNEVLKSWSGNVTYSSEDSTKKMDFTNVAIGVQTCADIAGLGSKGEFYARVWVESDWTDEDEDSDMYYVTDSSGALVEITETNLEPGDGYVDIGWATTLEQDNAGWNVYRSATELPLTRLNEELLPAYQYQYLFSDGKVLNGERYNYYVEDVGLDGVATRHFMGWATPSPADFDGSCRIDGQDLIWLSASIEGCEDQLGRWDYSDLNEDGVVDELDWQIFDEYYGQSMRGN